MSRELREFEALANKAVLTEQEQRKFKFYQKTLATGVVNPTLTMKSSDVEGRDAAIVRKYEQRFAEYVSGKLSEANFRKLIDAGEFRTDDQQLGGWGRPIAPETFIGGDLNGGTTFGKAGGFTVPGSFYRTAINSTKQWSELLNADNVRLVTENSYSMPGKVFVGFDFSSMSVPQPGGGVGPGDTVQVNNTQSGAFSGTAAIPPAYAKMLTSSIYAITLRVERDLDVDSMQGLDGGVLGAIAEGFGEGFGRRVGSDLVNGGGQSIGQPQGVAVGAPSSGIGAALSYNTLEAIYFSVNRGYRNSSKCAWLMSDGTYQAIRKLTDGNGRPLIDTDSEFEKLFGKKLLVCPDLATYSPSPSVTGTIIFGDMSHYLVRCSQMWVQRVEERWADFSEVGLLARLRVDGILFDPSNGVTPPITRSGITG